MEERAESRGPRAGRQVWTGRLLELWGVAGSFRTGDDLLGRRNRGCVVLLVTLRITYTCARRLAPSLPAAGSPARAAPCGPPRWVGALASRGGLWPVGLWARRACRIRVWGAERVPCSGRPRPDAARGPGVVSADSCGPGAARGPASGGSDSRGGSFSSPWGPPRAAPPEGYRFPSFYYSLPACMLWFFLVHLQ